MGLFYGNYCIYLLTLVHSVYSNTFKRFLFCHAKSLIRKLFRKMFDFCLIALHDMKFWHSISYYPLWKVRILFTRINRIGLTACHSNIYFMCLRFQLACNQLKCAKKYESWNSGSTNMATHNYQLLSGDFNWTPLIFSHVIGVTIASTQTANLSR